MNETIDGIATMRAFLPTSPFLKHVGATLVDIASDTATLALPFAEQLITVGETVHGGAIATLIDTAGMAAAWATDAAPATLRGVTIGMTVNYLATALKTDLVANARVVRRGRSICHVDVEVLDADEQLVAKGLVTYKLG